MQAFPLLPWHLAAWAIAQQADRRPAAWLVHGPEGLGKRVLATALTAASVCEQPQPGGQACGSCPACGWLRQGQHPDVRIVGGSLPGIAVPEPEKGEGRSDAKNQDAGKVAEREGAEADSGDVGIDEVRAIAGFVNVGSHRGGLRVVVLPRADRLSTPAANALLKTLEEPPGDVLFILVSDRLTALPTTVISRCRRLGLQLPEAAEVLSWLATQGVQQPDKMLAAAGRAPMRALALAQQPDHPCWTVSTLLASPGALEWPVVAAEKCLKLPVDAVIDTVQRWVVDLAQVAMAGSPRYFPSELKLLQTLADRVDRERLLEFSVALSRHRAQAHHPLNARMRLETLFMGYRRCLVRRRT